MPKGRAAGTKGAGRHVAHDAGAPAHHKGQDEILAGDPLPRHLVAPGGRQHACAIRRQPPHELSQRQGRRVPVGRRDLRPTPVVAGSAAGGGPGGEEGRAGGFVDLAEIRQGLGALQLRHAGELRIRQADPQIKAERRGEVLPQGAAHGPAVHPAEDLPRNVAEGHRVIAARGPRRPDGREGRKLGAQPLPVEPQLLRDLLDEARQPPLMRQGLRHRDPALPRLAEGGPDRGHRLLVAELARRHEPCDQDRRQRLGGGEDRGEGLVVERPGAITGGVTVPHVERDLAIDHETEPRAQLQTFGEQGVEFTSQRFKSRRDDHVAFRGRGRGGYASR